ncbi:AAA family ATPase [Nesterenkonia sp. Act20]|uniref:AAA family ATPase n=1 Tax=Nesterenkonia sp. Act20 TaxID=1483432 RepID=UPI001C461EFC
MMLRLRLSASPGQNTLTDQIRGALAQLSPQVSSRPQPLDCGGAHRFSPSRPGVIALVVGEDQERFRAGHELARELGLELFRIDLGALFSSHIDETEKSVSAVLEEAERSGGLILFDEADVLFGRRNEAHEDHDGDAITEVEPPLRLLEASRGAGIFAVNHESGLDSSSLRRLRRIVEGRAPEPSPVRSDSRGAESPRPRSERGDSSRP